MSYQPMQPVTDGITRIFAISFTFLDKSHVKVYVNNSPVAFTFINTNTIQLDVAPPLGSLLVIRRETPIDNPSVVFEGLASLDPKNLDNANKQLLFYSQEQKVAGLEAKQSADSALGSAIDAAASANTATSAMDVATEAANTATTSAEAAEAALLNAEASANEANTYAEAAEASKVAAEVAATEAQESAAQAATLSGLLTNAMSLVNVTDYGPITEEVGVTADFGGIV